MNCINCGNKIEVESPVIDVCGRCYYQEKQIEITWEQRDEETVRGYLSGHPETTLWLLKRARPDGRVNLLGAFVPDEDEKEEWDIENAKTAAHVYLREWLMMFAQYKAPNDGLEPSSRSKGKNL